MRQIYAKIRKFKPGNNSCRTVATDVSSWTIGKTLMKTLADYSLTELKLIYSLLHANVSSHSELMDSELLTDLQNHLQQAASREGVDVTHHAQWKAWLDKQSTFLLDEAPGDIGA